MSTTVALGLAATTLFGGIHAYRAKGSAVSLGAGATCAVAYGGAALMLSSYDANLHHYGRTLGGAVSTALWLVMAWRALFAQRWPPFVVSAFGFFGAYSFFLLQEPAKWKESDIAE